MWTLQKQFYTRQVCFSIYQKLTLIDPSSLPLTTTVKTGWTFKHVTGAE
jgi:hypothetical protein